MIVSIKVEDRKTWLSTGVARCSFQLTAAGFNGSGGQRKLSDWRFADHKVFLYIDYGTPSRTGSCLDDLEQRLRNGLASRRRSVSIDVVGMDMGVGVGVGMVTHVCCAGRQRIASGEMGPRDSFMQAIQDMGNAYCGGVFTRHVAF